MLYSGDTVRRYASMFSLLVLVLAWPSAHGLAQPLTKAMVADRIVKVENGVDEFRKYLERRGDNAATAGSSAPAQGVAVPPPNPRRLPRTPRRTTWTRPSGAEPIDQPAAAQVRCDGRVDRNEGRSRASRG